MEIITQLDPKYTDKIASIQKQTQQDLSEIIGKAITSGRQNANDLYYQTLQADTLNALQLFQAAGLVGCLDTDPSVPYPAVIQEYLEQKQARDRG
jgi:hypothetical protein